MAIPSFLVCASYACEELLNIFHVVVLVLLCVNVIVADLLVPPGKEPYPNQSPTHLASPNELNTRKSVPNARNYIGRVDQG